MCAERIALTYLALDDLVREADAYESSSVKVVMIRSQRAFTFPSEAVAASGSIFICSYVKTYSSRLERSGVSICMNRVIFSSFPSCRRKSRAQLRKVRKSRSTIRFASSFCNLQSAKASANRYFLTSLAML